MSKIFFNPLVLMGLTFISIVFSVSLYNSAKKTRYSTQNLQSLQQEVATTKLVILQLEGLIKESQQPFTQEKIIRDELLMKKPGEYVIQIPDKLLQKNSALSQVEITTPWEEWQKLLLN